MYVYDTIENKEVERNEYYVAVVRKELASRKKGDNKEDKKEDGKGKWFCIADLFSDKDKEI